MQEQYFRPSFAEPRLVLAGQTTRMRDDSHFLLTGIQPGYITIATVAGTLNPEIAQEQLRRKLARYKITAHFPVDALRYAHVINPVYETEIHQLGVLTLLVEMPGKTELQKIAIACPDNSGTEIWQTYVDFAKEAFPLAERESATGTLNGTTTDVQVAYTQSQFGLRSGPYFRSYPKEQIISLRLGKQPISGLIGLVRNKLEQRDAMLEITVSEPTAQEPVGAKRTYMISYSPDAFFPMLRVVAAANRDGVAVAQEPDLENMQDSALIGTAVDTITGGIGNPILDALFK